MSTYVIVNVTLRDPDDRDAFERYAARANELLAAEGAEVVAFDPAPRVLEGDWRPRMVVVQRYPDRDAVTRLNASDAYRPLKQLRHRIADTDVVVVEGI